MIKIEIGAPRLTSKDIPFDDGSFHERIIDYPLMINNKIYPVTVVSMGNPHCAVFVDRFPARIEWHQIGREIESHPFFPNRTNVEFVRVHNREEIEVLFWERGVGETLSSGSGSYGAAVAAILKDLDRTEGPGQDKHGPGARSNGTGKRKGLPDRAGRIRLRRALHLSNKRRAATARLQLRSSSARWRTPR